MNSRMHFRTRGYDNLQRWCVENVRENRTRRNTDAFSDSDRPHSRFPIWTQTFTVYFVIYIDHEQKIMTVATSTHVFGDTAI
jgi:hypothetical protein